MATIDTEYSFYDYLKDYFEKSNIREKLYSRYYDKNLILELDERIIKNLFEHTQYLNKYISYLTGIIDEKEFLEYSNKIAKDYESLNAEDLSLSKERINQIFEVTLDPEDISIMLNSKVKDLNEFEFDIFFHY